MYILENDEHYFYPRIRKCLNQRCTLKINKSPCCTFHVQDFEKNDHKNIEGAIFYKFLEYNVLQTKQHFLHSSHVFTTNLLSLLLKNSSSSSFYIYVKKYHMYFVNSMTKHLYFKIIDKISNFECIPWFENWNNFMSSSINCKYIVLILQRRFYAIFISYCYLWIWNRMLLQNICIWQKCCWRPLDTIALLSFLLCLHFYYHFYQSYFSYNYNVIWNNTS